MPKNKDNLEEQKHATMKGCYVYFEDKEVEDYFKKRFQKVI